MAFAIAGTTGAGQASVNAGSKNVTGFAAGFSAATHVGKIFYIGAQWGIVVSVSDSATMTLDRAMTTSAGPGAWGYATTSAEVNQTGTDTSLAGLSSVPGVTTNSFGSVVTNFTGPKKLYDMGGLRLNFNGTVTQDANKEHIFFNTSTVGGCLQINSGAAYYPSSTVNLGLAGLTAVPTYQLGISSNRAAVGTFNDPQNYTIKANAGSTFSPTGLMVNASLNIFINGGGTCTDSIFVGGTGTTPLFSLNSNSYVVNGLKIPGMHGLIFGANNRATISGLNVLSGNCVSQHDGTGWTTPAATTSYATFLNYISPVYSKDFRYWWNGGYEVINSSVGSGLNITANASNQYGNGFTMVKRAVGFSLSSPGVAPTSAVIFSRDTNNNQRRSLAQAGFTSVTGVPDYSQDQTYLWQANSSGVATAQNVTTAVHTCNTYVLGDALTGRWDYRSAGNDSTDKFNFTVLSYSHQVGAISNQSLVGTGTLTVPWTLFDDAFVTLSESSAIAKLASSFTVDRVTHTITVTANCSMDDLYDALKAYKTRPIIAQLEYPTINTQPISGSGTTALTAMSVVLSSGVVLSVGSKLNSLESGSVLASMTTGGAYTYTGGTLSGSSASPSFMGGALSIGGAGTYAFVIDGATLNVTPTAAGTYNLRGCTMSGTIDLRNTSAHAITVQVPNSATVITSNNTGGTITVDRSVPVTITAPNLSAGSRVRLYNVTDDVEMFNDIIGAGGLTFDYSWIENKTVRLQATYQSGITAKLPLSATGIVTTSGIQFIDSQVDDDVYNSIGIDGGAIAGFYADYVSDDVNITSGANFSVADLYAWWVHTTTLADGIRNFVGGITAIDLANFKINVDVVDIYIDSTTSNSIYQTDNRRIYRSDGIYPVRVPTTGGGGIDVNWRDQVLLVQSDIINAIKQDTSLIPSLM